MTCVKPITSGEELEAIIRNSSEQNSTSSGITLIRFWRTGCAACSSNGRVLENICEEYKKPSASSARFHFYSAEDAVVRSSSANIDALVARYPTLLAVHGAFCVDDGSERRSNCAREIDTKPSQVFRDAAYGKVEHAVHSRKQQGEKMITAKEAEAMFFEFCEPAARKVTMASLLNAKREADDFWSRTKPWWRIVF